MQRYISSKQVGLHCHAAACFPGVYTSPPGTEGSRLIHTYNPQSNGALIEFGASSSVGTGGMDSKVSYVKVYTRTLALYISFSLVW